MSEEIAKPTEPEKKGSVRIAPAVPAMRAGQQRQVYYYCQAPYIHPDSAQRIIDWLTSANSDWPYSALRNAVNKIQRDKGKPELIYADLYATIATLIKAKALKADVTEKKFHRHHSRNGEINTPLCAFRGFLRAWEDGQPVDVCRESATTAYAAASSSNTRRMVMSNSMARICFTELNTRWKLMRTGGRGPVNKVNRKMPNAARAAIDILLAARKDYHNNRPCLIVYLDEIDVQSLVEAQRITELQDALSDDALRYSGLEELADKVQTQADLQKKSQQAIYALSVPSRIARSEKTRQIRQDIAEANPSLYGEGPAAHQLRRDVELLDCEEEVLPEKVIATRPHKDLDHPDEFEDYVDAEDEPQKTTNREEDGHGQ